VCGNPNANTPNASAADPDSVKMFKLVDQPRNPTARPATIQPMVPHTRRAGNLLGSLMLANTMELPSPREGM